MHVLAFDDYTFELVEEQQELYRAIHGPQAIQIADALRDPAVDLASDMVFHPGQAYRRVAMFAQCAQVRGEPSW